MLLSHLYGRAKYPCKDLLFEEIESDDAVDKISKTLHNGDALTAVSSGGNYRVGLRKVYRRPKSRRRRSLYRIKKWYNKTVTSLIRTHVSTKRKQAARAEVLTV